MIGFVDLVFREIFLGSEVKIFTLKKNMPCLLPQYFPVDLPKEARYHCKTYNHSHSLSRLSLISSSATSIINSSTVSSKLGQSLPYYSDIAVSSPVKSLIPQGVTIPPIFFHRHPLSSDPSSLAARGFSSPHKVETQHLGLAQQIARRLVADQCNVKPCRQHLL